MIEQKCPRKTVLRWVAEVSRRNRLNTILMILALWSFQGLQVIASAADAGKAVPVAINAHFETTPDHVEMMSPCSAWTSVPSHGTCRGIARNTSPETLTGDWRGQSEYTYGFLILQSGLTYGGGVDHFTGAVSGCGTGSVVYQQQFSSDSTGNFHGQWQLIEGSGTRELAGLRGAGTYKGTTTADGSTAGDYSGTVYCSK